MDTLSRNKVNELKKFVCVCVCMYIDKLWVSQMAQWVKGAQA